jgi:hypothetical protein
MQNEMVERDEVFAERIKRLCMHGDTEAAHADADDIVIELLRLIGCTKTADAWQAVDKWYA